MKKLLTLSLFQLIITFAYAQKSFEGEVIYTIQIKSNLPNVTSERFSELIGTTQLYYMKGANYKSIFNGKFAQWSIYRDKDKKLYDKIFNKDTILWHDVTVDHDTIYKVVLKRNDTTILGYHCDKLTFTCNSGLQIYYFNSEFAVDPNLYINHQEGNWYAFLEKSKSIALKEITQRRQFTFTVTATSIERQQVDDKIFELPPGVEIVESKAKL